MHAVLWNSSASSKERRTGENSRTVIERAVLVEKVLGQALLLYAGNGLINITMERACRAEESLIFGPEMVGLYIYPLRIMHDLLRLPDKVSSASRS